MSHPQFDRCLFATRAGQCLLEQGHTGTHAMPTPRPLVTCDSPVPPFGEPCILPKGHTDQHARLGTGVDPEVPPSPTPHPTPQLKQWVQQGVDFNEFAARLRARLDRGAETYGDQSFERPLPTTLHEIEEELLDVSGWAFVAWVRLRRFMESLKGL